MELEGVAEIIAQFAEYISQLLAYLKEIFSSLTKKASADDETTTAA